MTDYKITCYCKSCNGGNTDTSSGKTATAGVTAAVHPDLYKLYGVNHSIQIEGIGERKIQDKHGVGKNVIDVYVGDPGKCKWNTHSDNGTHKVTF